MQLDQQAIIAAFNRSRISYNNHAFLQDEVASRLVERLAWFDIKPQLILNCSAHSNNLQQRLGDCYPEAHIKNCDLIEQFELEGEGSLTQQLSLPDQSVDLLVANLTLHWRASSKTCLATWYKALKPGGLLLFTFLGPETLVELQQSFQAVDHYPHVHEFMDMHNVGDEVLAAQFINPVMDREILSVEYPSLDCLFKDLRGTGAVNASCLRLRGLMGRKRWQAMQAHYAALMPNSPTTLATCEVIYGQAWRGSSELQVNQNGGSEILVPLPRIK